MSGKTLRAIEELVPSASGDHESAVSILAVGEPNDWRNQGNVLPSNGIAFVAFSDVTEATLEHFSPEVIYSPVLAPSFDCIELALLLNNLGFTGAYRAVASDLPKPELIVREVRQICTRLDFRIVSPD